MSKEKDDAPQLSECANTLDPLVKKRYMQKIAYIGVDPFVIFHAKNTMPNVFLPPSRLTSFRILFLKPVTTIRNNLRSLKVFKHITSWSLDLYKVSTDLSLPVSMSAGNCFQDRGTQREYSSKPLKHSIVKRILVFKR